MKTFLKMLMKTAYLTILVLVLLLNHAPTTAQEKPALTPKQILDKVDDLFRSSSSKGLATMTVTTAHWKRSLSLEMWSKGKNKSLVRILAPKKEKGTATLRSGNDIWNYLPKVKRVIKLPSSMMAASWMGSHFTNDDLVKESRMADDYTFQITFRGEREGQEIVEVTCHPKPDAAVVWGKVLVTAQIKDYLPLNVKYFDEDLRLARTMTFSDVAQLGGRRIPSLVSMVPKDKPEESTVISYKKMDFDIDLDNDFFSLRNLQR
ncbi:MAG: outer membrane lipoprotein-sorting protein [Deltaproteobacteria bacterium]|nr:MAG: outer membrane lipoprotein-sorting protein [Deltaproteobacteria bacterium]